jgi:hypothetical protein
LLIARFLACQHWQLHALAALARLTDESKFNAGRSLDFTAHSIEEMV